ncbi:MAG: hypothetical protein PHY99_05805, partial [Bacteroidales bacterium]|nr:hypothetical protein [Bacteroidales bacterium]
VTTFPKDEELESYVSQIIHYDQAGNEIARYEFRGPGVFESKTETKFNENNQVIEATTYLDEHEIAERKVYIRNQEGKVEHIDIEFSDGSISVQNVERDEENHTENWIELNEDDELESREFFKFDANGNMILRESYDFNDKLTEVMEYEYNQNGLVSLRRQLDERRKLILETEFKYSESGSLLLRASRNRRGDLSDYLKIEYNDRDQVVRQSFSGKYNFIYEYDEQGNPVVEEEYSGDQLDNRITSEYNADNKIILEDQIKYSKQFEYEYFD